MNGWAIRLENSEILTISNYTDFGKIATFVMMAERTLKNRVESILDVMNAIHLWDIPSLLFFTKKIKPNLVKSVMGSSTGRKIVSTSDSRIFSCLPKEILLAYKHSVRIGRLYESTPTSAEMPEVPVQPSGSRYIPKRTSKNRK